MDMNDNLNSVGYDSDLDSGDDSDFDFGFGDEEAEGMDSDNTDFDSESNDFDLDLNDTDYDESDFEVSESVEEVNPDSPEALEALLSEIEQDHSDLYAKYKNTHTAVYCKNEVFADEQNQRVRDAIKFAAFTTVAGGDYCYARSGETTVADNICKNKKLLGSIADTIKNNLSSINDRFSLVHCQGCAQYRNVTAFVSLSDFGDNDTLRHDDCKCIIDKEGKVLKRDVDEACNSCNSGASADEKSCNRCKLEAAELESYIKQVKECLESPNKNDGLGYEIEAVIANVTNELLKVYMSYALQLKAPKGVLADFRTDAKNPTVRSICSGMVTDIGLLPGEYKIPKDYTSRGTNYMLNLDNLSLFVKEAACRVADLRGAGNEFTECYTQGAVTDSALERSRHAPFFGRKDARTCLDLSGSSRDVKLKWDSKRKRFVSPFSAGGWHSWHIFGVHPMGTGDNNKKSMYNKPVVETKPLEKDGKPVLKNGEQVMQRVITAMSYNDEVVGRIKDDIRTQIWGFIRDNSNRSVGEYPISLWTAPIYNSLKDYTLNSLIEIRGDVRQDDKLEWDDERVLSIIREALCYMLTAAFDYILTFVVVHDCGESNITFDLVHFAYPVRGTNSGIMCLGATMNNVMTTFLTPNFTSKFQSLNTFSANLRDMKNASLVSMFDEQRDFRAKITGGTTNGLGELGTLYVSKYILVTNPTAYLGYPLFAYEPISRMQSLSGALDTSSILIGETMQGAKVELQGLLEPNCECVSLFAASRSGKGVMTLAMLGTLLQSGNPVIYFDGKPEMSGVLVDFILSLNKIARELNPDAPQIQTFPAFEFYQPCVSALKNKSNSTYHTKMSNTAMREMRATQKNWLHFADDATGNRGKFDALWRKYFCVDGELPESVATKLVAPPFAGEPGVNPTMSYLIRMRAYYLFYAINKNPAVYNNILNGQRLIVISDEVNRCNIAVGYTWLGNFARALKTYQDKLAKSKNDADKQRYAEVSAKLRKFLAFASDYFGALKFNATEGSDGAKLSSSPEGKAGLFIGSAIQAKQVAEGRVQGTNEGANPLYILIGQDGSEIYCAGVGREYSPGTGVANLGYTQWGMTLETYLMKKAVEGCGVCIQGNWTERDNNAVSDYHNTVIRHLTNSGYKEVESKYLHYINDGTISGFFSIRARGITQIARTYLVLNNNIPEYTEDYKPQSGETKNNVRPRTQAAILGANVKNTEMRNNVDATLNRMLFRNYDELSFDDKKDVEHKSKWVREPRVGFLGYFGMLIGVDLPDHVFEVKDVDGENSNKHIKPENVDETRFWDFFNNFKRSCDVIDIAFKAMPFVQFMQERMGRTYASVQDFIYDCDPESFIPLGAMLATSISDFDNAISGGNTANDEDAGKSIDEIRSDIMENAGSADVVSAEVGAEYEPLNTGDISDNASVDEPVAFDTESVINSEFSSAVKNVINQFNTINGILESKEYFNKYVRAVESANTSVVQTITGMLTGLVDTVNQLLSRLDTDYGDELANPIANKPEMTYEDLIGRYVGKYNNQIQTWINAGNSVNS